MLHFAKSFIKNLILPQKSTTSATHSTPSSSVESARIERTEEALAEMTQVLQKLEQRQEELLQHILELQRKVEEAGTEEEQAYYSGRTFNEHVVSSIRHILSKLDFILKYQKENSIRINRKVDYYLGSSSSYQGNNNYSQRSSSYDSSSSASSTSSSDYNSSQRRQTYNNRYRYNNQTADYDIEKDSEYAATLNQYLLFGDLTPDDIRKFEPHVYRAIQNAISLDYISPWKKVPHVFSELRKIIPGFDYKRYTSKLTYFLCQFSELELNDNSTLCRMKGETAESSSSSRTRGDGSRDDDDYDMLGESEEEGLFIDLVCDIFCRMEKEPGERVHVQRLSKRVYEEAPDIDVKDFGVNSFAEFIDKFENIYFDKKGDHIKLYD